MIKRLITTAYKASTAYKVPAATLIPRGGFRLLIPLLLTVSVVLFPFQGRAQNNSDALPTLELRIRDHLFIPAQLSVPANTRFRLRVINEDATPEEFESTALNREKVIMGNSEGIIFLGPLAPGEYHFFGEFNPRTAQGQLIATP